MKGLMIPLGLAGHLFDSMQSTNPKQIYAGLSVLCESKRLNCNIMLIFNLRIISTPCSPHLFLSLPTNLTLLCINREPYVVSKEGSTIFQSKQSYIIGIDL